MGGGRGRLGAGGRSLRGGVGPSRGAVAVAAGREEGDEEARTTVDDGPWRWDQAYAAPIFAAFSEVSTVTREVDVAEAVYRAANDTTGRLRFPAGPDAVALATSA